ncbi:MAG: glycosyl hydrolase-related protein [Phycisphaerae bacterium]|jgi:mannosylglycerate hydrolase
MEKHNIEKKTIGHIVSHTHWDREWRYPIWETRLMLVNFIDELIEILEKEIYPGFLLDGQVSPVLDYLDIRPEMAGRIKSLVCAGKLQIGPWYTLPDEYPVDGEAMVRNLLWGIRKSEELGGAFKAGYTPFGWGQTSQLPQIYAGFGMDVAMVGKRVDKHRAPQCEFIWRAPDGSELLSTRFGEWGRQNFYFKIHLSSLFGIYHEGSEWKYDWSKGGAAYHRADSEQMEQDHFRLDAPKSWHPETITPELVEECWGTMAESVLENDKLMMNGCDYTAAQKMFPEMVKRLNEVDKSNNRVWVHTTMPEYIGLMREKIDRSKIPVVYGELRDGPAGAATGNALSTRLYLKRLNKLAQNKLIRWAEPLSVIAGILGAASQDSFINKAWMYLLDSHPHDSINGVTQDKTVEDVSNRLAQVVDLSQTIGNRAMQELVSRIDTSGFKDDDVLLTVFNSLPFPRKEIVEAWVNMPMASASAIFGGGSTNEVQMFDAKGAAIGIQWSGSSEQAYCVAEIHTRAFPFYCQRHRVFFDTGTIPAGGYKIFRVSMNDKERDTSVPHNTAITRTGAVLKSPNALENEHLILEVNPNGTFNLTHKGLGRTWSNLNYYEDRGELGNYWINQRPVFDQIHTSLGSNARIWAEDAGPLRATLASEIVMQLPRRGHDERQRMNDELVDLKIRTSATLCMGEEFVRVRVDFENRHENHYLRAMFPSGLEKATHADAGGHFIVDHRAIRPQGPDKNTVWPDMATLPQNNFVDVSDGKIGIAFINDSLMEYEVLDNQERTVALSLLRAVKDWICTEIRAGSDFPSQKGGQCFGCHSISYAIRPHTGNWQDANIPLAAELFNVPAIPVQTRKNEGHLPAGEASLFAITNSMVRFSALKKAETGNAYVVRVYNPTSEIQTTDIRFHTPIIEAWETNLNESPQKKILISKQNDISVTIKPYKIFTVEIKTKLF